MNEMSKIEFHNREREKKEIMSILKTEPTLITFIYGPINSGKTELMNFLIKNHHESYKVFYINLRGRFIRDYDEFIKVLFDVEHEARYGRIKEFLKPIVSVLPESYYGIPIPKDIFLKLFKEKEIEDAFVYIETVLKAFYKNGYAPVLVIDELQVIGDLKVDELLIYKLFNFFVRLTKELHLVHVFVISSDSLFIERVYSEAMLHGRCRYLLVDDFDEGTTMAFLANNGFRDKEKELAWEYCGGKPVCLVETINSENREKNIKEMLEIRIGQIKQRIGVLKIVSKRILFEEEEIEIRYEAIIEILNRFSNVEFYAFEVITPEITYLVKENILFIDPVKCIIKPQSRLDLLAIRAVIKNGA